MILEHLFTAGQVASTLVLVYGAFLALIPARGAPRAEAKREERRLVLRHLHMDA